MVVLLGLAIGLSPGCSSEATCEGFENERGECQAICNDADCAPNHQCVLNDCRPTCTSQQDCPVSFNCLEAVADDGVTQGKFCLQHGYSADGSTGQYVPCAADSDCDVLRGYSCRHDECRIWGCKTHDDCKTIGSCASDPGVPDRYCQSDDTPRGPGQYNSRCPLGPECDATAGFICQGLGEGDIDAYCTQASCESDEECPTGYECATEQGFPCTDLCGLGGNPAFPGCVSAEEFDAELAGWSCGEHSLVRKICLKRRYCIRCETDADCAGLPNQLCAEDAGGTKICTTLCDPAIPNSCPGGTSSSCDVFDDALGIPTCSHRFRPESGDDFYSCVGTGGACHPCMIDDDCGSNGLCIEIPNSRERFCVDLDFTCETTMGVSNCPTAPSGIKMFCLDEAQGLQPGALLYHKCFAPDVEPSLQSQKTSCWPKG